MLRCQERGRPRFLRRERGSAEGGRDEGCYESLHITSDVLRISECGLRINCGMRIAECGLMRIESAIKIRNPQSAIRNTTIAEAPATNVPAQSSEAPVRRLADSASGRATAGTAPRLPA